MSRSAKEWSSPQNALAYLNVADTLPHRSEGESVLIDHLPEDTKRILDLGTGDGRLIRLIKANRPEIEAMAIDVSPTMLRSAREHFANDSKVKIIEHDLSQPLPDDLGYFDAVVSSFAIHHLKHERKRMNIQRSNKYKNFLRNNKVAIIMDDLGGVDPPGPRGIYSSANTVVQQGEYMDQPGHS